MHERKVYNKTFSESFKTIIGRNNFLKDHEMFFCLPDLNSNLKQNLESRCWLVDSENMFGLQRTMWDFIIVAL